MILSICDYSLPCEYLHAFLLPYECMLVSASRAALAELLLCDDDDDDVEGEPWRALLIQESMLTPPALPRDPSASEPEDESTETQRKQSHSQTHLLTDSCTQTHAHTHTWRCIRVHGGLTDERLPLGWQEHSHLSLTVSLQCSLNSF